MNKILNIIFEFFVGDKNVLTTSIDDAFPHSANIKDFPENPASKEIIEKFNKEGSVFLNPGVYDFNFKSFCLNAGKYSPYEGSGYLIAPLKGGKSDIVKRILKNSISRNDIQQPDVQGLIWAVLANGKYSDFSEEIRHTADKLLEKNDLSLLGKSFMDKIPGPIRDWLWREIEKRLPEEALSLWNKINELKMRIGDARTTFEELEETAMRFGKPPIPEKMLEIKEGVWSEVNKGCYIRIFPNGYSETRMQVYVVDSSGGVNGENYHVDITAPTPNAPSGSPGGGQASTLIIPPSLPPITLPPLPPSPPPSNFGGDYNGDPDISGGGWTLNSGDYSGVPANSYMQRIGFGGMF